MARRQLSLEGYLGEMVLMPSGRDEKSTIQALRITVFGPNFPQRAVEPEILVANVAAEGVTISPDQRSIRGYFLKMPPTGARIRVRYGESQEGVVSEAFLRERVRPLPKGCEDLNDAARR